MTPPAPSPPAAPDWSRRLKLRHMDVFQALVESGSLTAAANAMHLTQPALSHWLRELEDAVGLPLLIRGRRLRLTPAGEVFLRHSKRMLGDVERTREELAAVRAGAIGRVRVGVVLVGAPVLVPRMVVRLQAELPGLTVTLLEGTLDQLARMQHHELDVIIGRLEEQALNSGFPHARLYDEPVCVVSRPGHPLASRRRLGWQDVSAFPWIVPPVGTPMRGRLEAAFAAAGLPLPRAPLESASMIVNQTVLRDTDCLALMSGSIGRHYESLGLLKVLPLQHHEGLGAVGVLWGDPEPGAAVARVLEALHEEARLIAGAQAEGRTARSSRSSRANKAGSVR